MSLAPCLDLSGSVGRSGSMRAVATPYLPVLISGSKP